MFTGIKRWGEFIALAPHLVLDAFGVSRYTTAGHTKTLLGRIFNAGDWLVSDDPYYSDTDEDLRRKGQ